MSLQLLFFLNFYLCYSQTYANKKHFQNKKIITATLVYVGAFEMFKQIRPFIIALLNSVTKIGFHSTSTFRLHCNNLCT